MDDKGKEHVKNQERRRAEGEAAAGDQDFRGVPRVATLKLNYHENLSPDPNGHTRDPNGHIPGERIRFSGSEKYNLFQKR